jgi:hypothetical protein
MQLRGGVQAHSLIGGWEVFWGEELEDSSPRDADNK